MTGKEWKQGTVVSKPAAVASKSAEEELMRKIAEQGDKVRKLKSEKAEKPVVDVEVKLLVALKAEYKSLTGKDWKPPAPAVPASPVTLVPAVEIQTASPAMTDGAKELTAKINEQGDVVRNLKSSKAPKVAVAKFV